MGKKLKIPKVRPSIQQNYLRLTEHLVREYGLSLEFFLPESKLSSDAREKGQGSKLPPLYQQHDLLTPEQAATVLGLRSKTLANWRVQGVEKLPFRRIGGAVRYQYSDLVNFIETRKHENTSQY